MRILTIILLFLLVINIASSELNTSISITNSAPVISGLSTTGDLDFYNSSNKTYWCNATIIDNNGRDDISSVNATLWIPDNAIESSVDTYYDHYTNSSCVLEDFLNLSKKASCYFELVDSYPIVGSWTCKLTANDTSSANDNLSYTQINFYKCGDDLCTSGETCAICITDCGSCGDGSTGGSTGGTGTGMIPKSQSYDIDCGTSKTISKSLTVDDVMNLKVHDEIHSLRVTSLASDYAVFEIKSNPVTLKIFQDKTKDVELGDVGNLKINVLDISSGKIKVLLTCIQKVVEIVPEILVEESSIESEQLQIIEEPKEEVIEEVPLKTGPIFVAFLLILAILGYVSIRFFKKRKSS